MSDTDREPSHTPQTSKCAHPTPKLKRWCSSVTLLFRFRVMHL
jgi:hypothetical protein